jgi:hypothetical protein
MAAVLKSCSARLLCERTFFKCVYGGKPLPAGGGEKWGQLYPCPTAPAVPSHPHADEKEVVADTVIVATGAVARRLPFPGSDEDTGFWNKGISACAVCDGAAPMFRNQPIAVIGGGDSGALLPLLMPRPALSLCCYYGSNGQRCRCSWTCADAAGPCQPPPILSLLLRWPAGTGEFMAWHASGWRLLASWSVLRDVDFPPAACCAACEEGQFLTKYGSKVYIIHRRDELRASKIMQARVQHAAAAAMLQPFGPDGCWVAVGQLAAAGVCSAAVELGNSRRVPF